MKIDKVYITCFKRDYYFTRICVASIRYWNKTIPIYLLKDLSNGDFDTSELEAAFDVQTEPLPYKNIGPYNKLYPFFQEKNERVFVFDSDIIWLGDLVPLLEQWDEDIIIDGTQPVDYINEASKWYFNFSALDVHYPGYQYPGFLFNAGQYVLTTGKFSTKDFEGIIRWKENMKQEVEGVFLCEDQGILNYVVADAVKKNKITYRLVHFLLWGWSKEAKDLSVKDVVTKQQQPFLVHWYGNKNGLISFLPAKDLLFFFEDYYFQNVQGSRGRKTMTRMERTLNHFPTFIYELAKKTYYTVSLQKRK